MEVIQFHQVGASGPRGVHSNESVTNRSISGNRRVNTFCNQNAIIRWFQTATGELLQTERNHTSGREHQCQTTLSLTHDGRSLIKLAKTTVPGLGFAKHSRVRRDDPNLQVQGVTVKVVGPSPDAKL